MSTLVVKGKAHDVGERLQAFRLHARSVELGADMRHIGVRMLERVLEPRQLQRGEIAARHRLGGAVEHRGERIVGGLMVHAKVAPGKREGYSISRMVGVNLLIASMRGVE